jgi:hypothetical protein
LRKELLADVGPADLAHGQRLARWGRACTALGYATAWIAPNPVSALLLALGNFARWTLVTHPFLLNPFVFGDEPAPDNVNHR